MKMIAITVEAAEIKDAPRHRPRTQDPRSNLRIGEQRRVGRQGGAAARGAAPPEDIRKNPADRRKPHGPAAGRRRFKSMKKSRQGPIAPAPRAWPRYSRVGIAISRPGFADHQSMDDPAHDAQATTESSTVDGAGESLDVGQPILLALPSGANIRSLRVQTTACVNHDRGMPAPPPRLGRPDAAPSSCRPGPATASATSTLSSTRMPTGSCGAFSPPGRRWRRRLGFKPASLYAARRGGTVAPALRRRGGTASSPLDGLGEAGAQPISLVSMTWASTMTRAGLSRLEMLLFFFVFTLAMGAAGPRPLQL